MKELHYKTMEQKVTNASFIPNMQKYAVNIQNSQIHIFYGDTNKLCLKLYGHKLPITDFDVSSDNTMLVSGSVDKDIKLWDL